MLVPLTAIRTANERANDRIIRALKRDHAVAWEHVGGLSAPSKMPGLGYSLPASECITGSKLAEVPGSVCYGCYALRGNYLYSNVKQSLGRRRDSLSDLTMWVAAMSELIHAAQTLGAEAYFRWHDSGDMQFIEHLAAIVEVARNTPNVKHWLPTREYRIVSAYLTAHGPLPSNLTLRLSAHMIDGPAPAIAGLPTSGVHAEKAPSGHVCPAPTQGNHCGECRACWTGSVAHVTYRKH